MRRAWLLFACLGAGGLVGWIGWQVSGSQWWYLAIPAAVAAGWLTVADPTQCQPRQGQAPYGGSDP
jgi:hypothetical protein